MVSLASLSWGRTIGSNSCRRSSVDLADDRTTGLGATGMGDTPGKSVDQAETFGTTGAARGGGVPGVASSSLLSSVVVLSTESCSMSHSDEKLVASKCSFCPCSSSFCVKSSEASPLSRWLLLVEVGVSCPWCWSTSLESGASEGVGSLCAS